MLEGKTLPNNVDKLKEIIKNLHTQYEQQIEEKNKELKEEKFKYLVLEEKLQILQRKFFWKKSEKISDEANGQLGLFNEAELSSNIDSDENNEDQEKITVNAYTRKKKRKATFPSHLPVKEETYEGTDEEKVCPCCSKQRPCIGEEVSREIDIIPEQIRIIKHVQKKYGPCSCEDFREEDLPEVITAKKPQRFIGFVRRKALDWFMIFTEKQLRKILTEFINYYNDLRHHQGIDDIPDGYDPLINKRSAL